MLKNSIYITGHSGFVGTNLLEYLNHTYKIDKYDYAIDIKLNNEIIINLAGKAHDLKNTTEIKDYYRTNTFFSNNLFEASSVTLSFVRADINVDTRVLYGSLPKISKGTKT